MDLRPLVSADLRDLVEIDGTIESAHYLHLDRGGEGLALSLSLESRPLREKRIAPNAMSDDVALLYRQIASGADEGFAIAAEHGGQLVAAAVAGPDHDRGTLRLRDLRVDYDFRRQGLATAIIYDLIARAREAELRAVAAETLTNNDPANRMLLKLGFEIAGVDTRRHSNHDIVKESATVFWYAALD